MTAIGSLLACIASAAPARAGCVAAQASLSVARLPEVWSAAVLDLIHSTAEPGHPWSCSGGTIDLELNAKGAVLGIAREGEEAIWRQVAAPEEVMPLGQALLAMPLASAPRGDEHGRAALAPDPVTPQSPQRPPGPAPARDQPARRASVAPPQPASSKPSRRLLLSAGLDGRGVGGSGVGWLGPTASAGLVLGRWLPAISVRQESAVVSNGPPISELSVAVTVQGRFEISPFELRAGLALRGAAVLRDLPRPLGEQSRLEGRIGALTSFVIPAFGWGNVVLSVDGDVVGVSRSSTAPTEPTARMSDAAPTNFPTYTLGGNVSLEVPL